MKILRIASYKHINDRLQHAYTGDLGFDDQSGWLQELSVDA